MKQNDVLKKIFENNILNKKLSNRLFIFFFILFMCILKTIRYVDDLFIQASTLKYYVLFRQLFLILLLLYISLDCYYTYKTSTNKKDIFTSICLLIFVIYVTIIS